MLGIMILLLLGGGALAVVVPTLGSTADAIVAIMIGVAVIGFVIFVWTQGGSAFRGGWGRRGRMGR